MPVFAVDWVSHGGAVIVAANKEEAKEIFEDNLTVYLDEHDDYEVLEIQEVDFLE